MKKTCQCSATMIDSFSGCCSICKKPKEYIKDNRYDNLVKLIQNSFGIALNANDFFNVACTNMILLDADDLVWVMPIFDKYGFTGIKACMAYIAQQMPIEPHITDEFKKAYAELELLNPEVHSEQ